MPEVLDLFAGCGGGTLGFKRAGFQVHGVDINKFFPKIFGENHLGSAQVADLRREKITGKFDVILAGPPCRPWSAVNLHRRREKHPDFQLLGVLFEHVRRLKPIVFILENVPPARRDAEQKGKSLKHNYDIKTEIICYSDFGAPIRRRRMFMIGIRKDLNLSADDFFKILYTFRKRPSTVRDAIGKLKCDNDPQHVFPRLRTIKRYKKYYRTGKYGWYILKWNEPSPSFGNVMKTYILHPDSFNGGVPRVISVREALCIMGFPMNFKFPAGMPLGMRYQMVADAISPVFSEVLAKAVKKVIA